MSFFKRVGNLIGGAISLRKNKDPIEELHKEQLLEEELRKPSGKYRKDAEEELERRKRQKGKGKEVSEPESDTRPPKKKTL